MIRVLLAEDQGMLRGALAMLLGLEDDIEVVAQVGTGDGVLPAALETRPDVALLDIEMPGRSGLQPYRGCPGRPDQRLAVAAADQCGTCRDTARRQFGG